MAAAANLKIQKITISLQRNDQFWRNLVQWCIYIWVLQTPTANKIWWIRQSKMAAAAILKNQKILIFSRPIDWFWQNLACWCVSTLCAPIANKISLFQKIQNGGVGHFENSKNCNISTRRRPIFTTFSTMMSLGLPATICQWNFTNLKIPDGGVRHFEKLTRGSAMAEGLRDS